MQDDEEEPGLPDDDSNLAAIRRGGSYNATSPFGLSPAQVGHPYALDEAYDRGIEVPETPSSQTDQRLDRLITGLEESGKRTSRIYEEREQALAPIRDTIRESVGQPVEKAPELKEPPPQPDLRTELTETAQSWMGMATMIAMIGAGRSRTAGTTGLNAMAGIFNGLREGNEDRIKHEFDRWKKSSEAIIANNKAMVEAYKLRLENRKYDLDTKIAEMQIVASEYQDRLMMEALERRNLVDVGKLISGHERIAQQAENNVLRGEKLKAQLETLQEKAKSQQESRSAWTHEAVKALFEDYWENGNSAFQGMRGRAQEVNAIQGMVRQMAQARMDETGTTMGDLRQKWNRNAGERRAQIQIGQRVGNYELSTNEFASLVQPVRDALANVPRTDYRDINSLRRAIGMRSGSAEEARLNVALNGLVNVYARALTPIGGVVHQTERDEARKIIDTALSNGQLEAILSQMELEIYQVGKSIRKTIDTVPELYRKPSQAGTSEVPQRPPNVPPGSAYSPSRKQWRDPSGKLYNADGAPAQ